MSDTANGGAPPPLMCPSAQPEMQDSIVLGVFQPTPDGRRLMWLEKPQPATPQLLARTGEVDPRNVFRFAARCEESKCVHFEGTQCNLAQRIVSILPAAAEELPPCQIRPECRWYLQEGKAACYRCPEIVTHPDNPNAEMVLAATPR